MAQNPFKTPEFKAQFREWNARLEEEGFKDAENFSLDRPPLKTWHSFRRFRDRMTAQATTDYFDDANEVLHSFRFESERAFRIWAYHCQGLSVRDIEEKLHSQMLGYHGITKTTIHRIITTIQKESGMMK